MDSEQRSLLRFGAESISSPHKHPTKSSAGANKQAYSMRLNEG
jgi:hypothetical protein